MFQIEGTLNLSVSQYQGMTLIDIRKYFEKDGNVLPTKRGISLTVEQWDALLSKLEDIKVYIEEEVKAHANSV